MTDNDKPKHDREFHFVMNEAGDLDGGPTLADATTRLRENCNGQMLRAVKVTVHMAPPEVEDCGDLIIPDAATTIATFSPANDR